MSWGDALHLFPASQCPFAVFQGKAKEQITENRLCGPLLESFERSCLCQYASHAVNRSGFSAVP
jgi:hypothetical protein